MQDPIAVGTEPAEVPERIFVKPKTLNELLHALCMADEMLLDVNLDEVPDLLEQGKVKIDSYKYIMDRMESMIVEMDRKETEYASAKSTLKRQLKRLKEHLAFALINNGFEKFTGNQYKCWVQYSESVDLKLSEPGAHHKIHFPNLIKTTYEWKKTDIKRILKLDPEKIEDASDRQLAEKVREFASIAKRPGVRFSVLKDL